MKSQNKLLPSFNDGRFFFSPILGCRGACTYCYLSIRAYRNPRINEVTIEEIMAEAQSLPGFVFGKNGTIISIGAWGDIFPNGDSNMISHSIKIIKELLLWKNPIQIMSKNKLSQEQVADIAKTVQYKGQLLYSTTITTLQHWKEIEPLTSNPVERLETCRRFHEQGIHTNVLLKPFFTQLTGLEIEEISDLLLKYNIDFCTIGVLYWDEKILKKISFNPLMKKLISFDSIELNHLDCVGDSLFSASQIKELKQYVNYMRQKGIVTFLKSSCVNANMLKIKNQSNYYDNLSPYCVNCGNCKNV